MTLDTTQLESEVCAGCSPEVAAVYADVLIERGDPRGEIVALDVALATGNDDGALRQRREELIDQWLGADRPPGRMRYGFLDLDATGAEPLRQLESGFRGAIAPYVRAVAVAGDQETLRRAFETVSSEIRPHLVRCSIVQWDQGRKAGWGPKQTVITRFGVEASAVERSVVDRLCEATPRLTEVRFSGRAIVEAFSHPNVTTMQMSGYQAVKYGHLPKLVSLDVAFHSPTSRRDSVTPPSSLLEGLFEPTRLPHVRTLDLSRNGPGESEPFNLGGAVNVHGLLQRIPIVSQLDVLRVPPVRRQDDVLGLQHLIDRLPDLHELVVTRVPNAQRQWYAALNHPHAGIAIECVAEEG